MSLTPTTNLLQRLSPLGLAGPIFDKELRVASRRRRLYLLRFAYVAALVLFVVRLWYSVPRSGGSGPGVVQMSRLGEMGKQIVVGVVWFQFLSGQILAAALLSDAISAEIRQRTLDVLLVTPVRSFQIVLGKLLSKLLQLVSLLAISLPMLAVVRVFGGVPWDYLIAGLCITLSAGLFAGSLSLFSSVTSRQPYHAVLIVVLWDMVVWGLLPIMLTALSSAGFLGTANVMPWLRLTNPFVAVGELTQRMLSGSGAAGAASSWPWLCMILVGSGAVLLAWSVRRVRRVGLHLTPAQMPKSSNEAVALATRSRGSRAIRPVVGSPVAWKEQQCAPLFRTWRQRLLSGGALLVVLCVMIAVASVEKRALYITTFLLVQIVQLLFVIDVIVTAAGSVAREREARTWPILLMTTLEDGEIIKGKALGVFRRNLPLLLPLPLLYLLMIAADPPEPRNLGQLTLAIGWVAVGLAGTTFFLLGTGLYFSTRLKTTTAAVAATFAAYVAPKFLVCGFFSPLTILGARVLGIGGSRLVSLPMLAIAAAPAVIHFGVGLLFMRLAVRRVRRDVF